MTDPDWARDGPLFDIGSAAVGPFPQSKCRVVCTAAIVPPVSRNAVPPVSRNPTAASVLYQVGLRSADLIILRCVRASLRCGLSGPLRCDEWFPAIANRRHHFGFAPAVGCVRASLRRRHPLHLRDDRVSLRSGHP